MFGPKRPKDSLLKLEKGELNLLLIKFRDRHEYSLFTTNNPTKAQYNSSKIYNNKKSYPKRKKKKRKEKKKHNTNIKNLKFVALCLIIIIIIIIKVIG